MGFTKKAAIVDIRIPMSFRVINSVTGSVDDVDVIHNLTYPNTKLREQHDQASVKVRGRKVKPVVSEGNWILWRKIVVSVEGYDDLVDGQEKDLRVLVDYFGDDIGRLHVDEAISRMFDMIRAEDSDWEKKSELSSEQASGEPATSVPISVTK